MKDDKIDRLEVKLDEQTSLIQKQSEKHSKEIAEMTRLQHKLLGHTIEVKQDLKELHIKFDMMFDFVASMARFPLPMWIGSSVFKTQLDHLIKDNTLRYALTHLKVMFCVALYRIDEETQTTEFVIYFCCTNFADVGSRIRKLFKQHCLNTTEPMAMLRPQAIYLISQEINCERAKLQQLAFGDEIESEYDERRKAFTISLETTDPDDAQASFDSVVENVYQEDLQGYQMRRAKAVEDDDYEISENIINHMIVSDNRFFEATLPLCQEFIDCYLVEDTSAHSVKPVAKVSTAKTHRADLGENLSNTMYPLHKINRLLIEDAGTNEVDAMMRDGVISKRNVKSLFKTAKAAADAEDFEFDKETKARMSEVNEDELPDTDEKDAD